MNMNKKCIYGGAIASLALLFTKLYIDRNQNSKHKY